jgi:hypothetical protein
VECSAGDDWYGHGQGHADMERSAEDAWYRDWQGHADEEFAGDASHGYDEGQHEATSSSSTAVDPRVGIV